MANESTAGGGFVPSILANVQGTNHAVEGRNSFTGTVAMLAGNPTNGTTAVYALAPGNSQLGVDGEAYQGRGVQGTGLIGVAGVVTMSGQTAMLADTQGNTNSIAFHAIGNSIFDGAANAVTFNTAVYFNGPTFGVSAVVPVPLTLTGANAFPGSILTVTNTGGGYGIRSYINEALARLMATILIPARPLLRRSTVTATRAPAPA